MLTAKGDSPSAKDTFEVTAIKKGAEGYLPKLFLKSKLVDQIKKLIV